MCKRHLLGLPMSGKRKHTTIVRLMMLLAIVSFSFLYTQAQHTDTNKPKNSTNPTGKKATATKPISAVKPKKDTTLLKKKPVSRHAATTIVHKTDSTAREKAVIAAKPHTKAKDSTAKHTQNLVHTAVQQPSGGKMPLARTADPLFEKTVTVPYLPLKEKPIFVMDEPHPRESKDALFFAVCGLFLLYGIVRSAFPKYMDSLFRNLFSFSSIDKSDNNTGQNNLPSLLLNILFCFSAAMLATLVLEQAKTVPLPSWQIWLLGSLVLGGIYLAKFLTIYLSGWIFNAAADAGAYMYVVFLVNKIIGLLCLPAILVFAFAENPRLDQYISTVGIILLTVLLLYRYVVTFSLMARNLRLNAFHFFLYLCSVEIIPVLVLYKFFFKELINWI